MVLVMQGFGGFLLIITCQNMSAYRVAMERTQKNLNSMSLVYYIGSICDSILSFHLADELGISRSGVYFNIVLFCSAGLIAFLGSGLHLESGPVRKPIYWSSLASMLIFTAYFLLMKLDLSALLAIYDIKLGKEATLLLCLLMGHGLANVFAGIVLLLGASVMSNDVCYTYSLNRAFAVIYFGFFFKSASDRAWWSVEAKMPEGFLNGQTSGIILFFCLFILSLSSTGSLDRLISVENAVYHEPSSNVKTWKDDRVEALLASTTQTDRAKVSQR